MWRLISWLFMGHVHHWKIIKDGTVTADRDFRPCGNWYVLQCDVCGAVKGKTIST